MNTEIPGQSGEFDPSDGMHADQSTATPAKAGAKPQPGTTGEGPGKPARVLVVLEEGFNLRAIDEILRREHPEVMVASDRAAAMDRVESEQVDVVLLCSNQSGRHAMEMLTRITSAKPALPVIVVTSPNPSPGTGGEGPPPAAEQAPPAPVDAALLLRSVRGALTEPKIKRLIRLTGSHGEPRFMARNARWLSEELQARYSSPFHCPPHEGSIHLPTSEATAANSPAA